MDVRYFRAKDITLTEPDVFRKWYRFLKTCPEFESPQFLSAIDSSQYRREGANDGRQIC